MNPSLLSELRDPQVREAAVRECWRQGQLRYLLHPDLQRRVYDFTHTWKAAHPNSAKPVVWDLHRAAGKTFELALMATERGYWRPAQEIRFGAESQTQADELIEPNLRKILDQRPKGFISERKSDRGSNYYLLHNPSWPQGSYPSRIWIIGCRERADRHRGKRSHMILLDECRDIDSFEYLATTVFGPHFSKMDYPVYIMSSTPPESMDHAWSRVYCTEAADDGRYFKGPVVDTSDAKGDKDWTEDDDQRMLELFRSKDSAEWKREMLCAHISDPSRLVIPEFDDEKHTVDSYERPKNFIPLVVADGGYVDYFACLFGYVDFLASKLVIEDSILAKAHDLGRIARLVTEKERELYGTEVRENDGTTTWAFETKPRRHADMKPIELDTISNCFKCYFQAADNHDPDAYIAAFRDLVARGKFVILRKNEQVRRQLRNAIRDENGKLTRSDAEGHWDAVMACVYMNMVAPWFERPRGKEEPIDTTNKQVRPGAFKRPGIGISRAGLRRFGRFHG